MSKRIISAQHARNTAAKGKALNPLAEAQAAVPGVTDGQANAFVQAAKQVPAGKAHKAEHKADTDADTTHKSSADDAQQQVAHDTAPVESTASGAAHMMMVSMDASADQASGASGSGAAADHPHHHSNAPIFFGVAALAVGGTLAAVLGGSDNGSGTPTPTPATNHAPTFASGTGTATVAENTVATTTVLTATATDADAGDTITYSLTGADAALFAVSSTGVVTFKASPDFETPTDADKNNVYLFNVVATDKAGLTATQAETVTVSNVNEAPTFAAGTQAVNVAENTAIATTVLTATATDKDASDVLTYSLTGADAGLFAINASTGVVTFKASPDFENPTDTGKDNVYNFNVVATDKGTPGLTATQAETVTVTNVNDAPVITAPNGGTSPTSLNVFENSTVVGTIVSTDQDAGATKTYSLSGVDAAKFSINQSTGVLSFVAAPNFEVPTDTGANNVYDVIVTVTDNGTPGLTASQTLAVNVIDQNEAPTITSAATFSVAENSKAVGTVTASDVDAGDTKTFSISGTDAAKFAIDSATGALSFVTAPNFEAPTDVGANNVYDLTVTVTDKGLLTATQNVAVTVTNLNEPPAFTSSATFSVAENTTVVGTAVAPDPDAGAVVTYSISGGVDAAKFAINASTGALTFVTAPNFEVPTDNGGNNVYDLTVRASDGTNNTDQNVAVTVTNVNEVPVIDSGATGSVNENLATSTIVYTAHATDPDVGNTIAYSLTGTDASAFNINASTGEVRLNNSADFEAKPSYSINVVATDNGNPVLAATKAVTINVVDQPDTVNLPNSGTVNAGIQAAGQTDQNSRFVEDGDVQSSVVINNFTANDVIVMTHSSAVQNDVSFSRDFGDTKDLRIDYFDVDSGTTSTIIVNDVLDAVTAVSSEDSARAAMGFPVGTDFFQFG